MGYCAQQTAAMFFIDKGDVQHALDAVLKIAGYYETPSRAAKEIKFYNLLPPALKLMEIVNRTFGYEFEVSDEGDITGIRWTWEKITGCEKDLFKALSPFLKDENYVEMRGEDGTRWRYTFKDGKMIQKNAKTETTTKWE